MFVGDMETWSTLKHIYKFQEVNEHCIKQSIVSPAFWKHVSEKWKNVALEIAPFFGYHVQIIFVIIGLLSITDKLLCDYFFPFKLLATCREKFFSKTKIGCYLKMFPHFPCCKEVIFISSKCIWN